MGVLADRLDRMRVSVTAPGRGFRAELTGRSEVRLSFARGYYRACTESELERQLTAVARLLYAERTRQYHAALRIAFRSPSIGDRPARVPRDLAYREARDQLVAEGRSPTGRVAVAVVGMREWRVAIAPRTIRDLDEGAFAEEVRAAASELIRDQFCKIIVLKTTLLGAP